MKVSEFRTRIVEIENALSKSFDVRSADSELVLDVRTIANVYDNLLKVSRASTPRFQYWNYCQIPFDTLRAMLALIISLDDATTSRRTDETHVTTDEGWIEEIYQYTVVHIPGTISAPVSADVAQHDEDGWVAEPCPCRKI
jgi:hypothetical protein